MKIVLGLLLSLLVALTACQPNEGGADSTPATSVHADGEATDDDDGGTDDDDGGEDADESDDVDASDDPDDY